MQPNQIVSKDEWQATRRVLLAKEKAHMRAGDVLAVERRALPWLKIEKSYVFRYGAWTQHAGRAVPGLRPADRASSNVRTRMGGSLPRMLLSS